MVNHLLRQLITAIPTLLGAFAIVFFLTRLVPGDPVDVILEENYSATSYELIEKQLGLDKPVYEQYFVSLGNLFRGDLGTSFQNQRPVMSNIVERIPDTLQLTVAAVLISAIIGMSAGIIAAVRRNRWQDYSAMIGSLLVLCAPSFWLGVILLLVFSLKLGWLPSFGVGQDGDPISTLKHLVLPAFTLGASGAGLVARITRSSMIEALSQDYIRTGRAKGLHERKVVYGHALRNALIPVTTVLGLEAVTLLTGTVVVETVFARRGVGSLLVDSVVNRDYPQIQGVILFFVCVTITVTLVVDAVYGILDPRIRHN